MTIIKIPSQEERINSLIPKNNQRRSSRVYIDITDHINNCKYMITLPLYYRKLPDVIESGELAPFYDIDDKISEGRGMHTIAEMIDMRHNNVRISIVNKLDIIDIKKHLDAYMRMLKDFVPNHAQAKEYYEKAKKFQDELTHNLQKLIKQSAVLDELGITKKDIEDLLTGSFMKG